MDHQHEDRTTPKDEDRARKNTTLSSGNTSYAVAIYPYLAEQEDELDAFVGDAFVILERARDWWVVQRDRAGLGIVEDDPTTRGRVPSGCLLETTIPFPSGMTALIAAGGYTTAVEKLYPPLSTIATSTSGIALMDYIRKGEAELNLQKDDRLRIFKEYNNWCYVVKEECGDGGWAPLELVKKTEVEAPTTSDINTTQTAARTMQSMPVSM